MLKECSMDPNETTQKLLLQGTLLFFFFGLRSFPPLYGLRGLDPDRIFFSISSFHLCAVIHVSNFIFFTLGSVPFPCFFVGLI